MRERERGEKREIERPAHFAARELALVRRTNVRTKAEVTLVSGSDRGSHASDRLLFVWERKEPKKKRCKGDAIAFAAAGS